MTLSRFAGTILTVLFAFACAGDAVTPSVAAEKKGGGKKGETEVATFAGGCFWCVEASLEKIDGVDEVVSGFTGGAKGESSYEEVSSGKTGHVEAVQIHYDPSKVTYEELLEVFWVNHDPLTDDRQFCDWGAQYRPGIFYAGDEQREAALASRRRIEESGRFDAPIVTEVTELSRFWPAEEYHQDFYKKDPRRYTSYRTGCRRDARLQQLWGDS